MYIDDRDMEDWMEFKRTKAQKKKKGCLLRFFQLIVILLLSALGAALIIG